MISGAPSHFRVSAWSIVITMIVKFLVADLVVRRMFWWLLITDRSPTWIKVMLAWAVFTLELRSPTLLDIIEINIVIILIIKLVCFPSIWTSLWTNLQIKFRVQSSWSHLIKSDKKIIKIICTFEYFQEFQPTLPSSSRGQSQQGSGGSPGHWPFL